MHAFSLTIPAQINTPAGGSQFLRGFRDYLSRHNIRHNESLAMIGDVLFLNSWQTSPAELAQVLRLRPGVHIVHRVDGSAQDYGRYDHGDARQGGVNRFADLTIFQSHYCRHSTREKYPVIFNDGPVIHNPVDIECFTPEGPKLDLPRGPRIACVSWSANPMKGASQIYATARQHEDVVFVLCGPYPDAPALPNLRCLGTLGRSELARALRSCNALLTFSRNEACPNHVLEGLASGLPVLYHASGAMEELIGECGFPVQVSTFAGKLQRILRERETLAKRARRRAVREFTAETIFASYLEAISQIIDSRPRVPIWRRMLHAHIGSRFHVKRRLFGGVSSRFWRFYFGA